LSQPGTIGAHDVDPRLVARVLGVSLIVSSSGRSARAAPTPVESAEPAAAVPREPAGALVNPKDPAKLLSVADGFVDSGEFHLAAALYQRIVEEFPASAEAAQSVRALKIIKAGRLDMQPAHDVVVTPATPIPAPPPGPAVSHDGDTVLRVDPYSVRTAERLRLTTWEKLDFGVTSFLYGMSLGGSYALTLDREDEATTPIALGALVYTLGAVGYLSVGHPDRGDLPLALAITSYVATSTLLLSNLLFPDADPKKTGIAVTVAGLAAIPMALVATHALDLDPGDTQVVRDAGFWGLVLGTTSCLAFRADTITVDYGYGTTYSYDRQPSNRTIATWGAAGLFGGLGLGALAAAHSELSLERIRVTTWGGYGGGLVGALLVAGGRGSEQAVFTGITVGAGLGLVVTFLTTGGLDGIPPETSVVSRFLPRGMIPAVLSTPGLDAGSAPTALLGLAGVLN
jgi:hypothetical protein